MATLVRHLASGVPSATLSTAQTTVIAVERVPVLTVLAAPRTTAQDARLVRRRCLRLLAQHAAALDGLARTLRRQHDEGGDPALGEAAADLLLVLCLLDDVRAHLAAP